MFGRHVFIVGVARSGTTVLYRLLARHSKLAWLSPFSLRDGTLPFLSYIPGARQWDRIGHRHIPPVWSKNTHATLWVKVVSRLCPTPVEGNSHWEYVFPGLANDSYPGEDHGTRDRLRHLVNATLSEQKKERFLAKYPCLTRVTGELSTFFPNAQFIHIVRDGRAVVKSGADRHVEKFGEPLSERIGEWIRYWQKEMALLSESQELLGEARLKLVRYEDLCRDVPGTLHSLFSWLDLEPESLNLPPYIPCTNHRQLSKVSSAEWDQMLPHLKC